MNGELVTFLQRRFDEDETIARNAVDAPPVQLVLARAAGKNATGAFVRTFSPTRILGEVKAKRLLLDLHRRCEDSCYIVRVLSLPYTAHPDYRPEWTPA